MENAFTISSELSAIKDACILSISGGIPFLTKKSEYFLGKYCGVEVVVVVVVEI